MNIFYLSNNPELAAQYHCDKHCVKMILELGQLLSTAHRIIDGTEYIGVSQSGRKAKRWRLDDLRETILYSATHVNHPSAVWCRYSLDNYKWLVNLLECLCVEYTHRYKKIHKMESSGLLESLKSPPNNISKAKPFTEPTPAMPDEYIVPGNSVKSYRNYYIGAKLRMLQYKNREIPNWLWLMELPNAMATTSIDKDSNIINKFTLA